MGDVVGDAHVFEFYEVGAHAMLREGFIRVIFQDDALRVVLLEPSLADFGELDFHLQLMGLYPHLTLTHSTGNGRYRARPHVPTLKIQYYVTTK